MKQFHKMFIAEFIDDLIASFKERSFFNRVPCFFNFKQNGVIFDISNETKNDILYDECIEGNISNTTLEIKGELTIFRIRGFVNDYSFLLIAIQVEDDAISLNFYIEI